MRGGHVHRRSRPGRGTRAGPAQGRGARGRGHPRRGRPRGIRPRLRVSDVPRQRHLRRRVPAGHVHRPAPSSPSIWWTSLHGRAPTPSPTARPARATTKCGSSSGPTRSTRTSRSSPRGASGDLHSREQLLAYAAEHGIPIERKSSNASPYSMDANLLHISFEGNELEAPRPNPTRGCGDGPAPRRTRPTPHATSS